MNLIHGLDYLRDQPVSEETKELLIHIQDRLFTLGAILATDPEKALLKSGKERLNIPKITEENITRLENSIDIMNEELPPMTHFILPGRHVSVSYCHISRTVCRRAERLSSLLFENDLLTICIKIPQPPLCYLFVLARKLSLDLQAEEIKWAPEKK